MIILTIFIYFINSSFLFSNELLLEEIKISNENKIFNAIEMGYPVIKGDTLFVKIMADDLQYYGMLSKDGGKSWEDIYPILYGGLVPKNYRILVEPHPISFEFRFDAIEENSSTFTYKNIDGNIIRQTFCDFPFEPTHINPINPEVLVHTSRYNFNNLSVDRFFYSTNYGKDWNFIYIDGEEIINREIEFKFSTRFPNIIYFQVLHMNIDQSLIAIDRLRYDIYDNDQSTNYKKLRYWHKRNQFDITKKDEVFFVPNPNDTRIGKIDLDDSTFVKFNLKDINIIDEFEEIINPDSNKYYLDKYFQTRQNYFLKDEGVICFYDYSNINRKIYLFYERLNQKNNNEFIDFKLHLFYSINDGESFHDLGEFYSKNLGGIDNILFDKSSEKIFLKVIKFNDNNKNTFKIYKINNSILSVQRQENQKAYFSNNNLIIENKEKSGINQIKIIDLSGKEIFNKQLMLQSGENTITLNTYLPKNMYLIQIINNQNQEVYKLINME